MPHEMLRNYAVEASDLLTRWRRGEDVQDALAHQLRHVSAGLTKLQAEVVTLREALKCVDQNIVSFNDPSKMDCAYFSPAEVRLIRLAARREA